MGQFLADGLSNFIALMVTLPFVPFFLLYLGFYLYFQDRTPALRWSIDITTFILIISVSVIYNEIFESKFGLWLILILLSILVGVLGGLQNQIRGAMNLPKMVRGAWRLGFLLLAFSYVLLFFWGIGKNY
jgi:hypothetical protein